MNNVYLMTGGNLGNRQANLLKAAQLIEQFVGELVAHSLVYETEAWGLTDQKAFLNQVLQIKTALAPNNLLATLLTLELQMGRQRLVKYGARVIDIDILFYNQEVIDKENLTIPHPQIQNRRFVLVPLYQLAPALVHPVLQKNIQQLLHECCDTLAVNIYKQ